MIKGNKGNFSDHVTCLPNFLMHDPQQAHRVSNVSRPIQSRSRLFMQLGKTADFKSISAVRLFISFTARRASPETVELGGGCALLGLKVKILPHIIAFLWKPEECLQITKRVLPSTDTSLPQRMHSFIREGRCLVATAPQWLWDRMTGELSYSCC